MGSRAGTRSRRSSPVANFKEGMMDNSWQTKWDGRWDQFKGKVKQTWGQMTDDDCDVAEGKYDEMVGRIKTRTGEAEDAVRERISTF